jgi:DNA topoisomerase-1
VNKKYDFDNLSQSDIETLIEDKLQNIDKVLHNWTEEGILVEKARWDVLITKGKIKIELSKISTRQN